MKCLNCNNSAEENFCEFCGQKTSIHRFSLKHIFDNGILNGALMINKRFFFSLKELMTRPGHSIRDFLEGKRINHYNAFGLLLLLIAASYFIGEYSPLKLTDIMDENSQEFAAAMDQFTGENPRLFFMLNLLIMAITSFLLFKKSKINFAENIILNTYNLAGQTLLTMPFLVLNIFYRNKFVLLLNITVSPFITIGYCFWFYHQFFSEYGYSKRNLIFRSISSIIISAMLTGIVLSSILA
jgi:hypothetical protein